MKKFLALAAIVFGLSSASWAQTSSPIIFEAVGQAKGQITLTNNSLVPAVVTMEALSFNVADDSALQTLRPLDAGITVKYSETSFRLAAHAVHVVRYEAHCAQTPCWFISYSTFTQPRKKSEAADAGVLQIATHLPSVCYIYSKKPVQPTDIKMTWQDNTLVLSNTSNEYIRSQKLEAFDANGKKILAEPSFPMFPSNTSGHRRAFKFAERPAYVIVSFPSFKIDSRKG